MSPPRKERVPFAPGAYLHEALLSSTTSPRSRYGPRLGDAFPQIFSRSSPAVEKDSPTIYAASMIRFHPVDAAILLMDDGLQPFRVGRKGMFLGGYAILGNLMKQDPENYYRFLFEPCKKSAVPVEELNIKRSLKDLLDLFAESRFGFTIVTDPPLYAMLSLSDVLQLYQSGAIDSGLVAKDVAQKPVFTSGATTIRDALSVMFRRRIRRLFIEESILGRGRGSAFVSDREVISFIFSPRSLEESRESPESMLDAKMGEVGPIDAEQVDDDSPLSEVAKYLTRSQGNCVVCTKGLISPWDVVMKPYLGGRLSLG
jgi:CBS domain-containing protein